MRWGRRAPPVPAAAGVNLLRSPAPGGGGGREGEGARAAGRSAGGEGPGSRQARRGTGESPHAPEAGPPEHRPEERPKGRRGGNGGPRPPCGRWPGRGAAEAAATAQERPACGPAGGAGRRQRTPANGGGCPCAPPCLPRRRPPEGASTGQAGHGAGARAEGAAARRARSCGPPTPRCKEHHPQGTASGAKGKRPGRGLDASGKDNSLAESTPCGSIVPQRRRCCQAPEGGGPLLDIRTLFRQRGALTGLCLGLPRPGRDDVPFPSAS